jgi:hypothetical protein
LVGKDDPVQNHLSLIKRPSSSKILSKNKEHVHVDLRQWPAISSK